MYNLQFISNCYLAENQLNSTELNLAHLTDTSDLTDTSLVSSMSDYVGRRDAALQPVSGLQQSCSTCVELIAFGSDPHAVFSTSYPGIG